MLLKFTTTDMFNTSLVNVATGERTYEITTVSIPCKPEKLTPPPGSFSSSKTAEDSDDFCPIKEYPAVSEKQEKDVPYRRTQIRDPSGHVAVEVQWEGRHPNITIDGEEVGGLDDLFGTSSVRFMYAQFRMILSFIAHLKLRPKILAIPTKYDSNYVWTATADSLTVSV